MKNNHSSSFLSESKKIVALSLPMMGSQFINIASNFLCMAMIATLGHDVLAASALIFTCQHAILMSGMSILFSLSVLVGRAYGARDYITIGNYVQQGWALALTISCPIILLFWHIDKVLLLFGQSQTITHIVQTYFHASAWAVIPALLSTANTQFAFGVHKKALVVGTNLLSVTILLTTSYSLIFGKFGMPKLGVAGQGYAFTAQYSFFFLSTLGYFYFEKSFSPFELFSVRILQHLDHFVKMLKIGWPICVLVGGEVLYLFISGIMMGWLGTTALAAFQIVSQYYFLVVIPIFSLAQASSILVGHACGAKQFHEVKKLSYTSLGIVMAICLLLASIFLLFPKTLISVYLDLNNQANTPTVRLAVLVFSVIAFSQIFDGIRNVLIGILRGLLDTRFPMIMSLVTIWLIGMPISYLLAFTFHFGLIGFIVGGMLGMMIGSLVMIYRWITISTQFTCQDNS